VSRFFRDWEENAERHIMLFLRKRIKILLCLGIVIPLGFWMWRHYNGWGENWVRYYVSGAIYEIIWCLAFFFFLPSKANIVKIPVVVFIATCILEFLQLWKAEFLEEFRRTMLGAALIGTDFVWLQFPFYFLGSVVSVLLLAALSKGK